MHMRTSLVALVLGLLACCLPARADVPEAVRRYIDESTIAVGRLDLGRFDPDALTDYAASLMADVPEEQRQEVVAQMRPGLEQVQATLGPVRESGVSEVWLVLGPSSMQGAPPLVVVPVANADQEKAVSDLLASFDEDFQVIEGAVLMGSTRAIEAAQATRPVERPSFDEGFVAGNAAVQVIFEPTPILRIAGQAALRQLGQEQQVPPEASALVDALQTIKVSVAIPPEPEAQIAFSFPDAASAQQAAELLRQGVQAAQADGGGLPPDLTKQLAGALEPKVEGHTVTLTLDDREIRQTLGKPLAAAMVEGRERALQIKSASNLRMIGQAVFLALAEDPQASYPVDMSEVVKIVGTIAPEGNQDATVRDLLTNPRTGANPGYAYARPAARRQDVEAANLHTLVMLYERPPADAAGDYSLNILFADGHIEFRGLSELEELAGRQGFAVQRLDK